MLNDVDSRFVLISTAFDAAVMLNSRFTSRLLKPSPSLRPRPLSPSAFRFFETVSLLFMRPSMIY